MRRIKISDAVNKTGDTGDDYVLNLYDNYDAEPVTLNSGTDYKIKIGNDIGYLKTIQGAVNEDKDGLILSAKDLADFPDGTYYVEVWFEKEGLNYIFPSSGKARIKLDANIETIKGKLIPTITLEELRQEIAEKAVAGPKGDTGPAGKDGIQGPVGPEGKQGQSAYQIWLDAGNTGTEQDFLNSLKGGLDDNSLENMEIVIPSFPKMTYDYSGSVGITTSEQEEIPEQTINLQKTEDGKYKFVLDLNSPIGQLIQYAADYSSMQPFIYNTLSNLGDTIKYLAHTEAYNMLSPISQEVAAVGYMQQYIDKLKSEIEELKKNN